MKSQTKDKKPKSTKKQKDSIFVATAKPQTVKHKTKLGAALDLSYNTAKKNIKNDKTSFTEFFSKFAKAYEIPKRNVEEDRRRLVAAKVRSEARRGGIIVPRRGDARVDYVNVLIKIPRKLLNRFDQYCEQEDYSRLEGIRESMRETVRGFKFDQMEEKDTDNLKQMNELLENYKAATEGIAAIEQSENYQTQHGLNATTARNKADKKAEEEFSNTL